MPVAGYYLGLEPTSPRPAQEHSDFSYGFTASLWPQRQGFPRAEGLPPDDLPEMPVVGSVRGIRLEAKGHALLDPDLFGAGTDGARVSIVHATICRPSGDAAIVSRSGVV